MSLSIKTRIKEDAADRLLGLLRESRCDINDVKINRTNDDVTWVEYSEQEGCGIDEAITEFILSEYEPRILARIINRRCKKVNRRERHEIYNRAVDYAKSNIGRKATVREAVKAYLQNGRDEIDIDGLVNFRLKEYRSVLEGMVILAIDEFLIEQEYKDFIKLLRYFVDIQAPKEELVHVKQESSGYRLTNIGGADITDECMEDFRRQENIFQVNQDDMLLSSLITIAPRRIYIHNHCGIQNKELIATIQNVFGKRVVLL